MRLHRRLTAFTAIVVAIGSAIALSDPAVASPTPNPPPGAQGNDVIARSSTVAVALDQVSVRPVSGNVGSADIPACSGGSLNLQVTAYVDSVTRVTQATNSVFWGNFNCVGMAYMSISSNLFFRDRQVEVGSDDSCGTSGSATGSCGEVSTFGTYACGGIGNCDGTYRMTMGLWIDLPTGWIWGSVPAECSIEFGGRTMLCVHDSGDEYVPPRF
jgi:hypothetical protein